jgi:hypothetical protein
VYPGMKWRLYTKGNLSISASSSPQGLTASARRTSNLDSCSFAISFLFEAASLQIASQKSEYSINISSNNGKYDKHECFEISYVHIMTDFMKKEFISSFLKDEGKVSNLILDGSLISTIIADDGLRTVTS